MEIGGFLLIFAIFAAIGLAEFEDYLRNRRKYDD
jgi:hypothetical protein